MPSRPPSPSLRTAGLLVAIAAAPLPLLLAAHVVVRGDLAWLLVSDLLVAWLASRVPAMSPRDWAPRGAWPFQRREEEEGA